MAQGKFGAAASDLLGTALAQQTPNRQAQNAVLLEFWTVAGAGVRRAS